MNKKLFSTAILATLLATTTAFAAPPPQHEGFDGPGARGGFEKMNPVERQKRIEAFEKRLNLTDAQKAKIEKNRKDSKKKLEAIRKKEMKLRQEAKKILDQNKKDFEAILTNEQKAELIKIEAEREAAFKSRAKERADKYKNNKSVK